ncbi:Uu.00g048530.m01.CDS01 [Anthostomella pinea]|uniref:Uu.00g048530.m01.CDS01 n=1 Tax=Anthostomella pinea TaxID=933095 RepID=A0AAI8VCQ3_9PEZI|nr:Uu.00g048530.m01.CDS01 [Anthostomella pinea]
MTMTLDHQQRLGALNFDHMSSYSNPPHFTNPWTSGSSGQPSSQGLYSQGLTDGGLESLAKHHAGRTSTNAGGSMAPYGSIPVTASSAGSTLMADAYGQQDLLNMPQDLLSLNRMQTSSAAYGEPSYATASSASPVNAPYAASPSSYDGNVAGYAPAPMRSTFALAPEADTRRYSQSSVSSVSSIPMIDHGSGDSLRSHRSSMVDIGHRSLHHGDDRRSFADALDAGQGMLAMSQETPRAIYPPANRGRGASESYGFPTAHSNNSSISSASNYGGGYYAASVDSSVSDYSTAGSDIESVSSRTLPRPANLMTQPPPAPQSMMGQFSSKISSSTQKKHKCKICDKRFTRPSSLQTHMYSHTGEKPFCCEVEGCGRHFSVVSNLRRHRKVHKNDAKSEAGSEDHQDDQSD